MDEETAGSMVAVPGVVRSAKLRLIFWVVFKGSKLRGSVGKVASFLKGAEPSGLVILTQFRLVRKMNSVTHRFGLCTSLLSKFQLY